MPTKSQQPLELRLDKTLQPRRTNRQRSYGLVNYEFDVVRVEDLILYDGGKPYGIRVEDGERRVVRLR